MSATSLTVKGLDPTIHNRMRIAANYLGMTIADFVTSAIVEHIEKAHIPQAAFPIHLQWQARATASPQVSTRPQADSEASQQEWDDARNLYDDEIGRALND